MWTRPKWTLQPARTSLFWAYIPLNSQHHLEFLTWVHICSYQQKLGSFQSPVLCLMHNHYDHKYPSIIHDFPSSAGSHHAWKYGGMMQDMPRTGCQSMTGHTHITHWGQFTDQSLQAAEFLERTAHAHQDWEIDSNKFITKPQHFRTKNQLQGSLCISYILAWKWQAQSGFYPQHFIKINKNLGVPLNT